MLTPLVCLALAWNEPTAAELVHRLYPLDHLRVTAPAYAIAPLPLRECDHHESWESEPGDGNAPRPDMIVELVRQLIDPDEWEYAGRSIEFYDDVSTLEVVATESVQERVERLVEFLGAATMTPVTVRVDLLRITGDADLARLPTGKVKAGALRELEAHVTSGALRRESAFVVPLLSGVPLLRTRLTTTPYLRDYDAEIAEAAAALQPIVDRYAAGVATALRADRERDGGVLVQFAVRDSWLEQLVTDSCVLRFRMATDSDVEMVASGGPIQSPSLGFASIAGSCRLAEGETCVALAASPTPGELGRGLVFVVTLVKNPEPPHTLTLGDRTLHVKNVGGDVARGFSTEELGTKTLRWPPAEMTGNEPFLTALPVEASRDERMDRFHQAIERVYDAPDEEDEADSGFDFGTQGTTLYVYGSTRGVKRAAAAIRSTPLERADRSVTCRSAEGLVASVPVAVGEGIAVCGTQETYVHHYDVDVANRISMSHPQVYAGTSGYVFHVRGTTATQGARASLATHLREGGRGGFDIGSSEVAVHHLPRFLVSEGNATVKPEGAASLGEFALPGGETAAVTVSVRR